MPKIFFCYRREDSTHQAGRIFDQLAIHFGRKELFKDVDSMPLGLDFRRVLSEKVAQCDVLLAIIGDRWLGASGESGRRLDDPADFVRIEIESALSRNIPVIPVLVGDAPLPKPGDLPARLREFPFRHGLPVRPDPDFHRDVERLIRGIGDVLRTRKARMSSSATPPPIDHRRAATITAPSALEPPDDGLVRGLGAHSRSYVNKVLQTVPDSRVGRTRTTEENAARQERIVRIGILKSGNATYVNDIERALLAKLDKDLTAEHVRIIPSQDFVEWGNEAEWPATVDRLLARGGREGFSFLVGIGTQAAVALNGALAAEFGTLPMLLLGVTYPRLCGLVDSDYFRCESRQVACIRYGCGLDAVASLLYHRIFPNRKLCFVFQKGVPQDEMAFTELSTTRFAREGSLRLLRLGKQLQAQDLADEDTVYFSLYTFTRLFHEREFSILKDRLAVSTMQDNVRDGVAIAGVGTDHDWIGQRGAELMIEHLLAAADMKPDWGSRDVVVSPLVYWLNLGLARNHGIEFSPAVEAAAREVYD